MPRAVIFGCAGLKLSEQERHFFRQADPLGFILFTRNIETSGQVRRLTTQLRETVGRPDAPILIDQEGGRVARLQPPHWPLFPVAATFGKLALSNADDAIEACRLNASLIGYELALLGIDVNCAPVLDVPVEGAHDAIGDRALSRNAAMAGRLGKAFCQGLMQAGVMPVLKHMPGQGRALADSHHSLPVVPESQDVLSVTDFVPFRALPDMPWGMVAHVTYSAIDSVHCASTSEIIVKDIIRDEFGFRGILIADDICMQALAGTMHDRAKATLSAGLDLTLHCNGNAEEMANLLDAVPEVGQNVLKTLASTRAAMQKMTASHAEAARSRLATLMG